MTPCPASLGDARPNLYLNNGIWGLIIIQSIFTNPVHRHITHTGTPTTKQLILSGGQNRRWNTQTHCVSKTLNFFTATADGTHIYHSSLSDQWWYFKSRYHVWRVVVWRCVHCIQSVPVVINSCQTRPGRGLAAEKLWSTSQETHVLLWRPDRPLAKLPQLRRMKY